MRGIPDKRTHSLSLRFLNMSSADFTGAAAFSSLNAAIPEKC
jgi:hypothetical protein